MGALDGRIAIITGAGRGLGRSHALFLASQGAKVVVNDLGTPPDGADASDDDVPADDVAAEIRATGGEAVADNSNVADWDGGKSLVAAAVDAFGGLDVLVNNAGFLRDRSIVKMEEDDWDSVTEVHLKGHFVPTRWAAVYWREQSKAGTPRRASLVHTSSTSGLLGNPGQSNYGAAKAGVGAFSIICAQELGRYGVRSNCIVPAARTRLTESTPGLSDMVAKPTDDAHFDVWDPANVSPLVGYLASENCAHSGRTFFIQGTQVRLMEAWRLGTSYESGDRWTIAGLAEQLGGA